MNCANHPAVQAAAYCRTCGKALCANCARPVQGVIYCESCLATRLGHPPQAASQPGATVPTDTRLPSPGLAAALGFIPGVGAMYNGQFMKGIIHVMVFVVMIWLANEYGPIMVPVFFAYFFYSVFDAYKTAHAIELGQPVPDPFGLERMFGGQTATASSPASSGPPSSVAPAPAVPEIADVRGPRHSAPVGAIVLIVLGVLFLLDNTGWFEFHWVHHFWPLILIALGGWLLVRRLGLLGLRPGECGCERCKSRGLMGPAMLLTLGVLFLVAELVPFAGLSHTWPAILIVVGLVKVFQGNASTAGHIGAQALPGGAVPSTGGSTGQGQPPPSEVQPPPTEVHNG